MRIIPGELEVRCARRRDQYRTQIGEAEYERLAEEARRVVAAYSGDLYRWGLHWQRHAVSMERRGLTPAAQLLADAAREALCPDPESDPRPEPDPTT